MSTPVERLAARFRRFPRAAIPADTVRRAVEHDATHAGGGYIITERLYSPIPDNLHGLVQDESVVVDLLGFTDLESLLAYLVGTLVSDGFDPDDILTDDYEVLVDSDGNVMVDG